MRLRYRIPLAVIAIMMIGLMFLGSSYALWRVTKYQQTENMIETGCFNISFSDKNSINLTNAYPVNDTKGLQLVPYEFTIQNTCNVKASYTIYLNTLETGATEIPYNLIKYSLQKIGGASSVAKTLSAAKVNRDTSSFSYDKALKSSYTLETSEGEAKGILAENESVKYNLRLWIDESATTAINGYKFEAAVSTIAYAISD